MLMLAAVTDAAAATNTRRALVGRTGEALAGYLPLRRLELGECEAGAIASAVVASYRHAEGAVSEEVVSLKGTGIPETIRGGVLTFETKDNGERVVVIPLIDGENPPGYARMVFGAEANVAEDISADRVLETLGRILAFARRHCRLVERVARISSTAYRESREAREELRRLTESDNIVARSMAMRDAIEKADLVAAHDTTVLLRGESGTGKELLARRIHRLSRRARQPFIAVNCGALPETLVESELFGHEKGAFTGAVGRYRGRFERANNGTIFLDEIAELSPAAQVKLLRVLQEGAFERVGGEETQRVNVRVLAATHQPLEEMVQHGTFRGDLFYRIAVFPIVIAPLRERKDDIPALAHALLGEISKRLGVSAPPISAKGMASLLDHPWRGNVRELANTLERAVIVARGGRSLEFSDLLHTSGAVVSGATPGAETFDDGARRTIAVALRACAGRIYGKDGAAARLGMAPSTLQGKMRKLRMKRRDFLGESR